MCIILVDRSDVCPSDQALENAWAGNPDGAGVMWAEDGAIRIVKTLNAVDFGRELWEIYSRVYMLKLDTAIVAHWRLGTSGESGLYNVHPFIVNETTSFCHNGVLAEFACHESKESDTQRFNNAVLKKLPVGFETSPGIRLLIEEYVNYDKLVFLNNAGVDTIIHQDRGVVDDGGRWWSNRGFEKTGYGKLVVYGGGKDETVLDDPQHYQDDVAAEGTIINNKYLQTPGCQYMNVLDDDGVVLMASECEWCNCEATFQNAVFTVHYYDHDYDLCESCLRCLED